MSTSENIWQLDNVAVGTETYFFSFKLPWVPKVFFHACDVYGEMLRGRP